MLQLGFLVCIIPIHDMPRGTVRARRAVGGAPGAAAVPHGAAAAASAADERRGGGAGWCGRWCAVRRGTRRRLGLCARAAP